MSGFNPLLITSVIPLIGTVVLLFIPASSKNLCRDVTFSVAGLSFLSSLFLWLEFDSSDPSFQFLLTTSWLPSFNLYYTIGVDGISLFFIILTTFLILLCVLVSWGSVTHSVKEYLICFLVLEFLLIQVFCVLDLLLFYIFFESVLMPMFVIVGV